MPDDGHGWNKELEHDYYIDNVEKYGVASAREMSRRNIRSYRNELAGLQTPYSWRVNDTGTDAVSEDGFSLVEMARNPLDSKNADRTSLNHKEAAKLVIPTIDQVVSLAAQGEKLIIFPEHDVNEKGVVVRFITVLEQDAHDTKLYHGRRVDLGTGISISLVKEKASEIQLDGKNFELHEDEKIPESFVFSSTRPEHHVDEVRSTLFSEIHQDVPVDAFPKPIEKTYAQVGTTVKENKIESLPRYKPNETLAQLLTDPRQEFALQSLSHTPSEFDGIPLMEGTLITIWEKIAQESLHISQEQSEKLLAEVQNAWTYLNRKEEAIVFATKQGIAIAGALYLLKEMTFTEPIGEISSVVETWSIEQGLREIPSYHTQESTTIEADDDEIIDLIFETWSVVQHEQIGILIAVETNIIAGGVFVLAEFAQMQKSELLHEMKNPMISQEQREKSFLAFESGEISKEISETIDTVVLKEMIVFVEKIDGLSKDEQIDAINKEKEETEKGIVQIWEMIAPVESSVAVVHSPSEIVPKEEFRTPVQEFSFAIRVWILLKLLTYRSSLITLGEIVQKKNAETSLSKHIRREEPDGLIQMEPAPWLLFAIIWYLAMIREQGISTTKTPPTKKGKKRIDVIIFTYAS